MTDDLRIRVLPGHHRCHPNPQRNYGIADPRIWFTLRDAGWAISFSVFTGWGMPDEAFHAANPTCTHPLHQAGFPSGGPSAGAVDFHAPVQLFDHDSEPRSCDLLDGGVCWGDSGFLLGENMFDALRVGGTERLKDEMRTMLAEYRADTLGENHG